MGRVIRAVPTRYAHATTDSTDRARAGIIADAVLFRTNAVARSFCSRVPHEDGNDGSSSVSNDRREPPSPWQTSEFGSTLFPDIDLCLYFVPITRTQEGTSGNTSGIMHRRREQVYNNERLDALHQQRAQVLDTALRH